MLLESAKLIMEKNLFSQRKKNFFNWESFDFNDYQHYIFQSHSFYIEVISGSISFYKKKIIKE